MGAHLEGAVLVVGVVIYSDLVVQQLFGQCLGFPRAGQVEPCALEQGLEP